MSQLNFFLTSSEMNERLNDLIHSNHFQIFNGFFFETDKPTPVCNVDDLINFRRAIIWVNNVHEQPICSSQRSEILKSMFLFDHYKQPIIEIENCKVIGKLISPGRIYYKAGWVGNTDLRQTHKRMAEKIKRHFNKGLLTISPPFKISTGIITLIEEGYEIELGVGGKKINQTNIDGR